MGDSTETSAQALARLYDIDLVDDPGDLDLYVALARRTGGPILELGVGTGRLAVPLAAEGYHVTGIDVDPAVLARARLRAAGRGADTSSRLELVEADLVGLRPDGQPRFRLAFIALNSLMLLGSWRDQRAAIGVLAEHLAPGGVAAADVWLPDADDLARFDGRLILEYPRTDPETGRLVTKIAAASHDAATQAVRLTTIYEEGRPGEPALRWLREDRLRLVSADELRHFAEDAGLVVETVAGSYDLEPLGAGSQRAILIAAKPDPLSLV